MESMVNYVNISKINPGDLCIIGGFDACLIISIKDLSRATCVSNFAPISTTGYSAFALLKSGAVITIWFSTTAAIRRIS